jgi:hypothetical protein
MRRFTISAKKLGLLMEGIEFTDGEVCVKSIGENPSIIIYKNMNDVKKVHLTPKKYAENPEEYERTLEYIDKDKNDESVQTTKNGIKGEDFLMVLKRTLNFTDLDMDDKKTLGRIYTKYKKRKNEE